MLLFTKSSTYSRVSVCQAGNTRDRSRRGMKERQRTFRRPTWIPKGSDVCIYLYRDVPRRMRPPFDVDKREIVTQQGNRISGDSCFSPRTDRLPTPQRRMHARVPGISHKFENSGSSCANSSVNRIESCWPATFHEFVNIWNIL